jgi:hypothetical protein
LGEEGDSQVSLSLNTQSEKENKRQKAGVMECATPSLSVLALLK